MNNQTVTVNLIPGLCAPAVVRVSQYDVGRPLAFKVLDGTNVASLGAMVTTTIVGTKPSGLGFSVSGSINGNTVTVSTTLAMTQEAGMIPTEIRFTTSSPATVIGTANFILAVEPSPHPDGTTDGTHETMGDLQSQLNALDTRVDALEAGSGGSGLTNNVKNALLQIAQKVAYIDEHGQTYYNALYNALYPPAELESITATYTQSGAVYDTDSLDSLKTDLVVTANYAGGTSETVPASAYTLSGTLTVGTSTITVSYAGLTDTFSVTVSHNGSDMNHWVDGSAYANLTIIDGEYAEAGSGTIKPYSGWNRTGYVPCNGASTIYFPAVPQTYSSAPKSNCFYTQNHTYVRSFDLSKTEATTINVPSTAYYFIISSDGNAIETCISNGIVPHA